MILLFHVEYFQCIINELKIHFFFLFLNSIPFFLRKTGAAVSGRPTDP
jgi:hypothetical protein